MRTSATRIGRTVPAQFGGTVRAVWRRACAISPDSPAGAEHDSALVTLVREDVPMTALSIALRLDSDFDFAASGIGVGDRMHCEEARLVVYPAESEESIEVDLREAAAFDGLVAQNPPPINVSLLEPLAAAARRHRSAMCGSTVLGSAASDVCDALVERLSLHVRSGDGPGSKRAAYSLVGLGPGLTPAGDDILCGFMLGRRLLGDGDSVPDVAIRQVASNASGLTSDVSAAQLGLAAAGRFGEVLLDVAASLSAGDAGRASAAVARCLAEGASSGADALLGLAAGAKSAAACQPTLFPPTERAKEDVLWL